MSGSPVPLPGSRATLAAPAPPPKIAYFGYCGLIDAAGVTRISAALNSAVNGGFDEIYLCLSSNGGYVGDGVYLYNHIRGLPKPVTTHNTGTCASIAATLFVAGTRRLCSSNSIFMMHPIQVGSAGNMATTPLEAALKSALADEARTEQILRDRTTIPANILDGRRRTEVYITPDEALKYGLVHQIADFALPTSSQIIQL
jgi:ATP-dependent Clp protease, protease subunit